MPVVVRIAIDDDYGVLAAVDPQQTTVDYGGCLILGGRLA
jgi:hypothetical protein